LKQLLGLSFLILLSVEHHILSTL